MAKTKRSSGGRTTKQRLHTRAVSRTRPAAKKAVKATRGKTAKTKTSSPRKTAKTKTSNARKTTARKAAARKTAVRKTAARKTAVRKTAARKTAVRKTATRKSAVRKATARKSAVRKTAARKTAKAKTSNARATTARKTTKTTKGKSRQRVATAARRPAATKAVTPKATAARRPAATKAVMRKATATKAVTPKAAASKVERRSATATARGVPVPSAPVAPGASAADRQPLIGVRVGRLPPRAESRAALPPRPGFSSPHMTRLAVSPTLRREEITQHIWKRVDELAGALGISALRTEQRRAIRSVLEGKDTLVALPSGFGKSACYQVPAQLLPQPVVVVSPRAALGREHHDRLLHRRVPAVRLDASVQNGQRKSALARVAQGGPLIVLTTPDELAGAELSEALARTGIALLVVDDAHTVSEWSDELCGAATLLGSLIARLGSPPMMALLGAAPPAVRHDVVDGLGLRAPTVVDDVALRDNIVFETLEARGEVRQRALVQLVMRLRRPGIIYAGTPREVDAIHAALGAARVPVHRYHPELPAGERVGEQLNFMLPGRRTVMVATSAFAPHAGLVGLGEAHHMDRAPDGFGLGLDKRDVRFVIHWGAPASLEQYAREIGAAGRDGELSHAVILFEPGDSSRNAATLARHRIAAQHLSSFVRALEARAMEATSIAVESLALESGLTRSTADTLALVLDSAGLVSYRAGWLTPSVPTALLMEQARRLATRIGTLRAQDEKRLEAVSRYVGGSPSECRRVALARYFGTAGLARCGKCSACGEPSLVTTTDSDAPRRREPARDFSVTRVDDNRGYDRYQRFEHGYSSDRQKESLTAKLGDFGDALARAR